MLKEWLIDYSEQVIAGEIVACQKHKWACERFLRDVQREGTDGFPYVFDDERALRFLRWMTLFKHTQGVLEGKHIEPAPIQVFVFGNIYGWKHMTTGKRRFRKAYWQVARKNAKSQSLACVGSYETMAFIAGKSKVYVGATKKEQAQETFGEILSQLKFCEALAGKWLHRYGKIEHPKTGSTIVALSKDEGKTGDGKNVQCGIVDEYHAHSSSEIYDVLASGTVARAEPLMMIITTAGYELSYPCYTQVYTFVSKLLDPSIELESDEYFAMVNELDKDDNPQDESTWEKANPILCSYEEGRASLRTELKNALDIPEAMRAFLTKNMNIWVDQRDNGYMAMDRWKACEVKAKDMPDLTGKECIAGIDLSATLDLTSVGFEFLLDDGKYAVFSHSFIPEDTLAAKRKTDKVPYDLWVQDGWITATPGAVVDYKFIMAYMKKRREEQGWIIKEACYDRYNATQFSQDMTEEGFTMVEIPQGIPTLGEPTKNFREEVYKGNVIHDGNPVLAWALSNAVTRQDHNSNIMLDKSKAANRIDPAAALINAHVRAMVKAPTKRSRWEDPDAEVIVL